MCMCVCVCVYACMRVCVCENIYKLPLPNHQTKKRPDPPAGPHSQKVYLIQRNKIKRLHFKSVVFLYENKSKLKKVKKS